MLCRRLMKAKKRRRPNPSSSSSTSPVELCSEGEPWAYALSAERKHGSNGSGRVYGSKRSNRSDPRTSSACGVTRASIGRRANGVSAIASATATDSRWRTASRPNLMLLRNGEGPLSVRHMSVPRSFPSRPPFWETASSGKRSPQAERKQCGACARLSAFTQASGFSIVVGGKSNKPRFLSMKPRGSKAVHIRSNGYDAEFFDAARGADRLE